MHSIHADKPWNEVFLKSEVWNDCKALIAKLRTEYPWIYFSMVSNSESLLMWDE